MTIWEYLDRRAERNAARPIDKRLLANVIGCALISGFLGAMAALFVIPIPPGNEQIITYMIGQLSGFAGGIVAYHYTLSASQREQEQQNRELEQERARNTGKAFDAISAAQASPAAQTTDDAAVGARQEAEAAEAEADAIEGEVRK